ncbi:hypothetical protein HAX54_010177 [Datura stramonium]|uniref:Secreted protein n=1 Tax=Datura stramonium TaxID=4076 RepID=A0ABS8TFW5_DATST|nr:hypothetical protein [Datura stramonium]
MRARTSSSLCPWLNSLSRTSLNAVCKPLFSRLAWLNPSTICKSAIRQRHIGWKASGECSFIYGESGIRSTLTSPLTSPFWWRASRKSEEKEPKGCCQEGCWR